MILPHSGRGPPRSARSTIPAPPHSSSLDASCPPGSGIGTQSLWVTARVVRYPVGLPRTVVVGKRLLPSHVIVIEYRPPDPHFGGPAFAILIGTVKITPRTGEAADGTRVGLPRLHVDPIERPLLLRPVISKEEESGGRAIRKATLVRELDAAEERQRTMPIGRSVLPVGAACSGDLEALLVSDPGADQVVEIMTAAAAFGRIAGRGALGLRTSGVSVGRTAVRRGDHYATEATNEARKRDVTIHAVLSTASTYVDVTVYTRSHECQKG